MMVLLKMLILTLTFYELFVDLEATSCPKGQRVTRDGKWCENCPPGQYQPTENNSKGCRICEGCDKRFGRIVEACTKTTNIKCECTKGSVAWENDPLNCKCPIGFGIKHGECLKCEAGYFNEDIDSACKKWKECKFGVKYEGTDTSDVTCNDDMKANVTTAPEPSQATSLITRLISQLPHEGAQTQRTTTTTTTTSTSTTDVPKKTDIQNTPIGHVGIYFLILLIAGLLIVLTTVTCKLHINPCVQRKQAVPANDHLCRRPVEESGDDSLSSLKLNAGEP